MIWGLSDARVDRWIEDELVGGLSASKRRKLHARLREDAKARARYDRAVAAIRVLEGDGDFAPTEIDVVGRWLAQSWEGASEATPERRWWPAVAAALAAAVLLVWVSPLGEPGALDPWTEQHDGWQARGASSDGTLALEVLCVENGSEQPEGPLRVRECASPDLMGFAYRVAPQTSGSLTLFGIDADGDPMFYMPTPVDASTAAVEPARWRALPLAVRVGVNHADGPLRVYGLVSPVAPTHEDVEAWVEELAPMDAADSGDAPWLDRVRPGTVSRVCPSRSDCHAAELRLTVAP